jgi:hypothetical protein
MRSLSKLNWNRISWVVAIEAAALVFIASFFLPGGDDLYRYYYPFASGCLNCGFIPYYAQWILWPLSRLPALLVWPLWTLISTAGILLLCRFTHVNPALVILSFPALGQFWLGQIDMIIAIGLVLGLISKNPYLRGAGILLAMIKPQIAAFPVLILLLHQPRKDILKVVLLPVIILLLSFLVFGFAWPMDWFMNSWNNLPEHVWRLAASALWPYGLVFVLFLFLFRSYELRFISALVISALATPFFSVYSYLIFLVFIMPWWALPLSYAWFLVYPLSGKDSLRFAWILPIGILAYLLIRERKALTPHKIHGRDIGEDRSD